MIYVLQVLGLNAQTRNAYILRKLVMATMIAGISRTKLISDVVRIIYAFVWYSFCSTDVAIVCMMFWPFVWCSHCSITVVYYDVVADCPYYLITCRNGHCIRYGDRCDGENDCGDHSDERKCSTYKVMTSWTIVSTKWWRLKLWNV